MGLKVEGGAKFLSNGRVARRCAAPGSKAVRGVAGKPESVVHRLDDVPIIRLRTELRTRGGTAATEPGPKRNGTVVGAN